MDNIRLLYVEDDPGDRELTRRHLHQYAPEIEVRAVDTGREAREIVASQRFDVVLLGYRLPDVEGLELLREIGVALPKVPVVMVTDSGNPEMAIAALKQGAIDYVVKKPGYLNRLSVVLLDALRRCRAELKRRTYRLRVLYAGHEAADIDLTLAYLAAHAAHLKVETATTGLATLRALESGRYDLLLLDYRMSDLNGLEIVQELREQGIRLPVVMVTGHRDEETAVQAMKLGVTDYIIKREGYLTQIPPTIDRAIAQWAVAEEKEALLVVRDIARMIASTLDLHEVLQRVASAAVTLLKTDRSLLSFLSDDGTELLPAAWQGWSAEETKHLRFRIGQGSPGQAAALRRTVSGPDSLPEIIVYEERSALKGVTAMLRLSAPMVVHDRLLGVLSVAATGPRIFRRLDETLLNDLAAFAAVWIENARLYEERKLAALQLEAKVEERTRELEEALCRVEMMSQHKSQFLANMSHELRTPLNSILGFAELLQDPQFEPVTTTQGRYLSHSHSSGQHLLALINDLLDLSKVEAGRLELRPETFPLAEALRAALDPFRVQVDAKGVTLTLQVDQAPTSLVADSLRVKQMLYNLVSNAVKFTPAGGSITVTAKMVSRSESGVLSSQSETLDPRPYTLDPGDCVAIAVSDTGIGIKAEDLGQLFQEFTQLDSSFTKPQQGTGLGLALTKRLAELHGGTITVTSPGQGQGSTFTITLPLRPPGTDGRIQAHEA